jgi:hypothetical protein
MARPATADDADIGSGGFRVKDDAVSFVEVEAGVVGDDATKGLGDEPLQRGKEMAFGHVGGLKRGKDMCDVSRKENG